MAGNVYEMVLIDDEQKLYDLISRALKTRVCAVDTETTGLYWALGNKAFMATFCADPDVAYATFFAPAAARALTTMANNGVRFIFHHTVFDLHMLREWCGWYPDGGYQMIDTRDTMHGFRRLFPGQPADLKTASKRYLPNFDVDGPQKRLQAWLAQHTTTKKVAGKLVKEEPSWDKVPEEIMLPYATQDAYMTLMDYYALERDIGTYQRAPHLLKSSYEYPSLYATYKTECELARVVADMERAGFPVRVERLEAGLENAEQRIRQLVDRWNDLGYGHINPGSPTQLRQLLYGELGETVIHKTDAGHASTGEFALRDMRNRPVGEILMELRGAQKYQQRLNELKAFLGPDGRVHSSFKQDRARTDRFSSADPALQNLTRPDPSKWYTMVRDVFGPDDGKEFLFMDFSQIELRLAAEYLGDESMKQAFIDGTDFHSLTASRAYGVPLAKVTKAQRALCKILNFSILYGAGRRRVTSALRYGAAGSDPLTPDEALAALKQFNPAYERPEDDASLYECLAGELLNAYHRENPLVKKFLSRAAATSDKHGYITTKFGVSIPVSRGRGHVAGNAAIQGSAAGLMKETLIRTEAVCRQYCLENGLQMWRDVEMITTIHDEEGIHLPVGHAVPLARKLYPVVTSWPQFSVKIDVEFAIVRDGSSWAYKEDLDIWEEAVA